MGKSDRQQKGFSIRKFPEITGMKYEKVPEIIRITRVDEDMDVDLENYMDKFLKDIIKK